MKKFSEAEMPESSKEGEGYYHVFCGLIFGRYKDLVHMSEYKVVKEYRNGTEEVCNVCNKIGSFVMRCAKCQGKGMHPLCAWL